ncbi:hypothetical protein [Priestia aryabhattai]|uniref:hypothetical protein n=1 Tax=Priestia aryabhattai TaxID=412384 RepID=UPI003D27B9BA
MDATVKTTKIGIIGGVLGGISLLYVIINTLLIFNFFTGLIAAEKLQGLPIIAPIFLVPLMIVPAIIGFFIKKDKLCLWAIILNIILFLVPIGYHVIGTLVFGP